MELGSEGFGKASFSKTLEEEELADIVIQVDAEDNMIPCRSPFTQFTEEVTKELFARVTVNVVVVK